MALETTWFILIAALWSGFFVLEGFDFGIGMLVPTLGRNDSERRQLHATIGPFWDGNEVWLILAGGATFAAFPDWYATLFSAYYVPLFVVLVGLILRAVAIEYRDKSPRSEGETTQRWRTNWDWVLGGSSLAVPLLVGVAIGGMLGGIPIDSSGEFTGGFSDLLQPYALYCGVTLAVLCLFQGVAFARIRTTGEIEDAATAIAGPIGVCSFVLLAGLIVWTLVETDSGFLPNAAAWVALTFSGAAAWLASHPRRNGWGFVCSSATIGLAVATLFSVLYPDLMVSTTASTYNLTISDSSQSYTLTLMTIVAALMLPIVLLYTAWSYWVFRQRITPDDVRAPDPVQPPVQPPVAAAAADTARGQEDPEPATDREVAAEGKPDAEREPGSRGDQDPIDGPGSQPGPRPGPRPDSGKG